MFKFMIYSISKENNKIFFFNLLFSKLGPERLSFCFFIAKCMHTVYKLVDKVIINFILLTYTVHSFGIKKHYTHVKLC